MKKRIFSFMAVVLFMSSSLNAVSVMEEDVPQSCFEWADSTATRNAFMQGWTFEEEYNAFVSLYNSCS